MLLNTEKIIARQLALTGNESFEGRTGLTGVTFSPVPDGAGVVLNGDWEFEGKTISQPGKVAYIDPAGQPDSPEWDRVTLRHLQDAPPLRIARKVVLTAEFCRDKRVFLRFDAVYPAARFFWNGELLGEHFSGLTPWQIEITDRVHPGVGDRLEVELLRWHPFIQLDMPRHALEFTGLAQDAYCFSTSPTRLVKDTTQAAYDSVTRQGRLRGVLRLDGPGGVTPEVALWRHDCKVKDLAVTPGTAPNEFVLDDTIADPAVWSDEYPELYELRIGCGADVYRYAVGFRELQLRPDGARLNGNFVKFRGINHLTFHPEGGLYTPRAWLRENLMLMKRANVNAIRTHFAAPPALVELCDELGFYLLQEIPIDWGTHFIHLEEWVGPALYRIQAVIERDRHHPALMVWSVGNENMPESRAVAAAGWHHLRIFERMVHILDPERPAMFPPPGPANAIDGIFELRYGEIADVHYSFRFTREFLASGQCELPGSWEADKVMVTREEALARGWSGVWFSSEWGLFNLIPDLLNNPGGSLIADMGKDIFEATTTLEVFQRRFLDEWGFMRGERSCLGGAYFPWISSAATAEPWQNPWGWMRYAEDADWGVMTAALLPKPEYWVLRRAFSPVWFPARLVWTEGADGVEMELENQFTATDLGDCTFRVQTTDAGDWMTMLRNFTDIPVRARPGECGRLRIPLTPAQRETLRSGGALLIRTTLLNPAGFRVATAETFVFGASSARLQDQAVPIGPDAQF